ncbi:hypothetical protein DV515_00018800, partial [Chloebia gouldiae]
SFFSALRELTRKLQAPSLGAELLGSVLPAGSGSRSGNGSVHWQRPGKEPEADLPFHRYRAPSAEVEMTAYVLLAQLSSQPAPAQEELAFASLIAKWISSQQNPNGGFSSTQVSCFPPATSHIQVRRREFLESRVGAQEVFQLAERAGCRRTGCGEANCIPCWDAGTCLFQDTVVALQALSLYGAATYARSGAASKVALRSGGDFQQDFQVDPSNRLLLQRVPLPQVPGEYSVEVSGEGCVYLQVRVMGTAGIWEGSSWPGWRGWNHRIIQAATKEPEIIKEGGKAVQCGGAVRSGEAGSRTHTLTQSCWLYNVQPTQEEAPFMLHVHTVPEACVDSKAHKAFDIGINLSSGALGAGGGLVVPRHFPGMVGRRQLFYEEKLWRKNLAGLVGGCLDDQENLGQLEKKVLDCQDLEWGMVLGFAPAPQPALQPCLPREHRGPGIAWEPGVSKEAQGSPCSAESPSASTASLPQLGRETLSFSFTVERDIPVRGLKPAQVKVYDYYETGEGWAGGHTEGHGSCGDPQLPQLGTATPALPWALGSHGCWGSCVHFWPCTVATCCPGCCARVAVTELFVPSSAQSALGYTGKETSWSCLCGWLCLAATAPRQGWDWGCLHPSWDLWGKLGIEAPACSGALGKASLWHLSLCQQCQ